VNNPPGISDAYAIKSPPPGTSEESIAGIAELIMRLLRSHGGDLHFEADLIRHLLDLPRVFTLDTRSLAAAVIRHTTLVSMIPELQDPAIFAESWPIMCMALRVKTIWRPKGDWAPEPMEEALWNWRSLFIATDTLPNELWPTFDKLLKAYIRGPQ
jgi:hypothetical protein